MDARDRWQALQARLTAARAAVDAGDRATALTEITAALELDSQFLAAHALRDRILVMAERPSAVAPASDSGPSRPGPSDPAPAVGLPSGYHTFEQRARRRRVDRRIDAARAAIQQQRVKAAANALDEVIELDPNLPELAELTAQFDTLRRAAATPRIGPRVAAAAVFACALLGGTWLQDSTPILSRQIVAAAPLRAPLTPVVTVAERFEGVATTADIEHVHVAAVEAPAGGSAADPSTSDAVPVADDGALVTQALLGYRWTPDAANGPVGFDSCDPLVQGDAATAVCRAGAAAWNVTLRKSGASWKIETARAER